MTVLIWLAKALLGPVLLWQGRHLRLRALRLPEARGPRQGLEGAGPGTPLRLLVVGDSSAAGVGVDDQADALAQPVAVAVARALGRPVAWTLLARSGLDTAQARAMLAAARPGPADVLLTALGVNDVTGQRSPQAFIAEVQALLGLVDARLVLLSGVPPLGRLPAAPQPLRGYLGLCAGALDRPLQRLAATRPHTLHLPLNWADPGEMARDGFHPGPRQYRRWAAQVAAEIVERLGYPGPDETGRE